MSTRQNFFMSFFFLVFFPTMLGGVEYYSGKYYYYPKYEAEIIVDGKPLREFYHEGKTYVMGLLGKEYAIRVRNNTSKRVEVVVSIDGRDAIDGKEANYVTKRGYVLSPWQSYDIKGFRISFSEVAAFTFSNVNDSYAMKMGNADNVGVIGVAFFEERVKRVIVKPHPQPFIQNEIYKYPYRTKKSAPQKPLSLDRKGPKPSCDEKEERQGLGTAFGKATESRIKTTKFVRKNKSYPQAILTIYYNDEEGLRAMGIEIDDCCISNYEIEKRKNAKPFPENQSEFALPPEGWNRIDP